MGMTPLFRALGLLHNICVCMIPIAIFIKNLMGIYAQLTVNSSEAKEKHLGPPSNTEA